MKSIRVVDRRVNREISGRDLSAESNDKIDLGRKDVSHRNNSVESISRGGGMKEEWFWRWFW